MARIGDLLAQRRTVSFEFFPPASDAGRLSLGKTIGELEALDPDFVSVTYGAAGSARQANRALTLPTNLRADPSSTEGGC